MIGGKSHIELVFEDGTTAVIRLTPWALGLAEEKFGMEKAYGIRGMLYAAYRIYKPGDVPFEVWGPTVVELRDVKPEGADVDPPLGETDTGTVSPD